MRNVLYRMLILGFFILTLGLVACEQNDGPAEKAGERIDRASEDVADAADELTDE